MSVPAKLLVALNAALEAGRGILRVYEGDCAAELKADQTPVTKADRLAHEIILKTLKPTGSPILSEEGKNIPYEERKGWETFWLVDPLDGTKEFLAKNGEFTVNIALVHQGRPILGVVYAPILKRLFFAAEGLGAYQSEELGVRSEKLGDWIKVSKKLNACQTVGEGGVLRVVSSRSHVSPETEKFIKGLERRNKVELVSIGSSLKFCLVAEGKADIYPRFGPTMEWDTAAGHAVLEQAGGKVLEKGTNRSLNYNKADLHNPPFAAILDVHLLDPASKAGVF